MKTKSDSIPLGQAVIGTAMAISIVATLFWRFKMATLKKGPRNVFQDVPDTVVEEHDQSCPPVMANR
jgi:hypothetical protein